MELIKNSVGIDVLIWINAFSYNLLRNKIV